MKNTEKSFKVNADIWVTAYDEEDARSRLFNDVLIKGVRMGVITDYTAIRIHEWKQNAQDQVKTKHCAFPTWLRDERTAYHKPISLELEPYINVFDHFGYIKQEGVKHYVSEPYGPLRYHTIKRMVDVCSQHDIAFDIFPYSPHYPNRTILIRWYQTHDKLIKLFDDNKQT